MIPNDNKSQRGNTWSLWVVTLGFRSFGIYIGIQIYGKLSFKYRDWVYTWTDLIYFTEFPILQYIKQVIVKLFTNDKPLENQCGVRKYYSNVKKKNLQSSYNERAGNSHFIKWILSNSMAAHKMKLCSFCICQLWWYLINNSAVVKFRLNFQGGKACYIVYLYYFIEKCSFILTIILSGIVNREVYFSVSYTFSNQKYF